jgi:mRNA-degrading endonuclease RelE of RelBE toxin-antitoxin system
LANPIITRRAENDLSNLPAEIRDAVDAAVLQVGANPRDHGKHLKGTFHCRWSAHARDRRVLYRIEGAPGRERVVIIAIPHRGAAYPPSRH